MVVKELRLKYCATIQMWLIFTVNSILFIFGTVQVGIACYVLSAGSDRQGFAADVVDGNESTI